MKIDSDNIFFFQAEDGIRDYKVTGVQTCALPISTPRAPSTSRGIHVYVAPVSTSVSISSKRSPARLATSTTTWKWPTPECGVSMCDGGNRTIASSVRDHAGVRQSTLGGAG